MKTCALVVTWNGEGEVGESLESLARSDSVTDVLVVDNASRDATVDVVRSGFAAIERRGAATELLTSERNLGFVEGVNLGLGRILDQGDHELVVLLNQDAGLSPGFVGEMDRLFSEQPSAGAAGGKIYYPGTERLQFAGGEILRPRMTATHRGHHEEDTGAYDEPGPTSFVTGAALVLRTSALAEVGLLEPLFSPGYYEDVDLCERLRAAGWDVLYRPTAIAWHHESSSFGDPWHRWSLAERNRLLFAMRWLADPQFLAELRSAELAHLEERATSEERRHLAGAYARVMLCFGRAARSRLPAATHSQRLAVLDLLVELRRAALVVS